MVLSPSLPPSLSARACARVEAEHIQLCLEHFYLSLRLLLCRDELNELVFLSLYNSDHNIAQPALLISGWLLRVRVPAA